jgi:hypothetical protein
VSSLAALVAARSRPVLPLVAEPAGAAPGVVAAAERAASAWRLSDPRLLRLAMNGVFACGDDVVLRVGRPTADPTAVIRIAGRARAAGVATPRAIRDDAFDAGGGLWATAWERVHPIDRSTDWEVVGRMIAALHRLPPPADAAALPWCGDFPWWRLDEYAPTLLDTIDAAAAAGLRRALNGHGDWELAALAGPLVVAHGDVHPGNVVTTDDGPVLLDWDLACIGPPAWDHAALMTWTERWGGEPGVYEAFAAGYGESLRGERLAESLATMRLVAATLLRVRAGASDPAVATEAAQRLRYWRADADAPRWNAQ